MVFTNKMFEKHQWKSDILSKDAGHRPASLLNLHLNLKCHSSTVFFKHFISKNQLPGLYVSGKLVKNRLKSFKTIKYNQTGLISKLKFSTFIGQVRSKSKCQKTSVTNQSELQLYSR